MTDVSGKYNVKAAGTITFIDRDFIEQILGQMSFVPPQPLERAPMFQKWLTRSKRKRIQKKYRLDPRNWHYHLYLMAGQTHEPTYARRERNGIREYTTYRSRARFILGESRGGCF